MQLGKAFISTQLDIPGSEIGGLNREQLLPFLVKQPFSPNVLEREIKDGNPTTNFPRVFTILLGNDGEGSIIYQDVDVLQYRDDLGKVLLLLESSGGSYMSPTIKFAAQATKGKKGEPIPDQFKNGIDKAISNLVKYFKAGKKDTFLSAILEILTEHRDSIAARVLELQLGIFPSANKIGKKVNSILTVLVNGKYPGEIPEFAAPVLDKLFAEFAPTRKSSAEHLCSVTGNISSRVSGEYKPYLFYTIDKPGYIAGGFDKSAAIKNFPVSLDAAMLIEVATRVLEEQLRFQVGGVKCFVIPKTADLEGLKSFLGIYSLTNRKTLASKKALQELSDDEVLILEHLGAESDDFRFDFVFHEMDIRGNFTFLLYLRDVKPSRIREIWTAIQNANNYDPDLLFFATNLDEHPAHFSFRNLRALCKDMDRDDKDDAVAQKRFLALLQAMFLGTSIDADVLLHDFFLSFGVRRMRARKQGQDASDNTLLSWAVKDFVPVILTFKNLALIKDF